MKKFKPMLLVMIAAFLMFSFSSSAFAANKVVLDKHEYETLVTSEKVYTEGETVEVQPYMMAAGEANVYVMFEDAETEDSILMGQLVFTPEMKGVAIKTYHKNPRPGYYYLQISGDTNAFIHATLKKLKY
ncbi:MAG: hypothetical protein KID09_11715 [Paenibacillus macerans]|uniref:hypothetical protein n=1 Tax=Paenibacillus macerans TaxID=44252 RepID=UPI00242F1D1F|nr:hypothetical protein [Paenibacillus macerans]MBS5911292.1 hypothetical protein [Paenibacillus macerans]MDU5946336.1 hypothetical protein [Paenibacillus macerans]